MYFTLTKRLKNILIEMLREYWAGHPDFPQLSSRISGKYIYKERPQQGMVVKTGSANPIQLSAQNYIGIQQSYVMLAQVPGSPGRSLEWVREDSSAIRAAGGSFPTAPGVYYGIVQPGLRLTLDPLLEVRGEAVTLTGAREAVLMQPAYPGSLRVFEVPSGRLFRDYTLGSDGVTITLGEPLPAGIALAADYRFPGEQLGPWGLEPEKAYAKLLPGVVLCFGRRLVPGDQFALVVTRTREDAYEEYGGKWELTVDVDVFARDVNDQSEIADRTVSHLLARARPVLSDMGLEVTNVSLGGESEEVYDENADDYFFNSSFSLTVEAEWGMYVPIVPRILSYDQTLTQLPRGLQLEGFRDPYTSLRRTMPSLG